jgi:hypothetical protein
MASSCNAAKRCTDYTITSVWTLRLNVVSSPFPCVGTLNFTDVHGKPVGMSSNVVGGVSRPAGGVGHSCAEPGHRAYGNLHALADGPYNCVPGVEVFDQSDGYIRVLVPPGPLAATPAPTSSAAWNRAAEIDWLR